MNSKRNIIIAAAIVVVTMVFTTSWSVVTSEIDDPNDPNEIDPRGIWTGRLERGDALSAALK